MLADLNIRLFQWFHVGARNHPFWDGIAIFFSESGPYILMFFFIIAWFLSDDRSKMILIEATEAAIFGLLVNQLIGFFYFYPRPYMLGLYTPLIPHTPETSFPSDHATLLFTASTYLLAFRGCYSLGLLLLSLAIITAWARVYSGIHFPFDMLGSLVVGNMSAFIIFSLGSYLSHLNGWIVRAYDKSIVYVCHTVNRKNGKGG